ncbi:MAG: photosystem II manganese-stabilizing polypeptide [Oscillatoriaceae bacterium SKW80]|nr:photosystem II manganese-stabilizing polypeptide [Oscillatoriaceae bacterium SKYG93]MCX8121585.1 photosystem II manganese-stabilizing polypeptide [Oscillatoriaceae bacterium SKW80]MDW8452828.1 photosystem II manganese-stabilizing polypeptide [Oscillatoriaceae cyanobacterium SKYGB_i_bin93]HIK27930.1 photosystem II manganese-stabilizing polypeptide [Oscillatoriaceae cyanobacterium M7585_C2015_266]
MSYRAIIAALLAVCLSLLTACSEGPATASNVPLTYDQIKGTGLANNCPTLEETARGSIVLDPSKSYVLTDVCLQPTSFFVKEEPLNKRQEAEYVAGKLMTRLTTSLSDIQGQLKLASNGAVTFVEQDGIDFQPITVKLPGGELVPFLFTIKSLVATSQPGLNGINTSTDFQGEFKVPSYRGSTFLDPKGRGEATGYDNAIAVPARADVEEYERTNVKRADVAKGKISLQVSKVDETTGEIAGIFESEQPSDTDLGAKDPLDVKIRGVFYGRVQPVS